MPFCVDFEQCDIGALVGTDNLGLELALVGELDQHFVGVVDDVCVGENKPVRRKNEAGAGRLLLEFARLPRLSPGNLAEAAKEFVEGIVFGNVGKCRSPRFLRHIDAHDRRPLLLVELGEVGQPPGLRRHRGCERDGAEQRAKKRPDSYCHAEVLVERGCLGKG